MPLWALPIVGGGSVNLIWPHPLPGAEGNRSELLREPFVKVRLGCPEEMCKLGRRVALVEGSGDRRVEADGGLGDEAREQVHDDTVVADPLKPADRAQGG